MERDSQVFCPLFHLEINVGLCADIMGVGARMLKKSAVPEIERFTEEQVQRACDACPYLNEKLP